MIGENRIEIGMWRGGRDEDENCDIGRLYGES